MNATSRGAAARASIRVLTWSVRRELWEHRSIWAAPLVAAVLGVAASAEAVPHASGLAGPDATRALSALGGAFGFTASLVHAATVLVAWVYCLGALHGERRDRSILFWKSLPVSDRATIGAKAAIPIVVLPLIGLVLTIAAQAASMGLFVTRAPDNVLIMRTDLVGAWTHECGEAARRALWDAPVYAWLLLVSAWADRAVFLWAVLPPVALCILEKIVLRQSRLPTALRDRLLGDGSAGNPDALAAFARPEMWGGIIACLLLLAAACFVRRRRQPI